MNLKVEVPGFKGSQQKLFGDVAHFGSFLVFIIFYEFLFVFPLLLFWFFNLGITEIQTRLYKRFAHSGSCESRP